MSPVYIQVETDASKSFHLGPYDRTRFDLVEQFHPLQTASLANGDRLKELKKRVEGVKSVQPEPAIIEENFNAEEIAPQDGMTAPLASHQPPLRLVFGEWSAWSQWTPCVGGERSRIRACSSKRAALRIVCHGDAKETQKCFSAVDSYVPVAEDPWTIEREISGDFKI
ncbi:hypothetical protein Q1695_003666 [Nippostrongylus brasiliensis]|nr:hypothetical protein Q1695_003666 [Nippostrongylus brasiliensis]